VIVQQGRRRRRFDMAAAGRIRDFKSSGGSPDPVAESFAGTRPIIYDLFS
jgi:hypothetical protein